MLQHCSNIVSKEKGKGRSNGITQYPQQNAKECGNNALHVTLNSYYCILLYIVFNFMILKLLILANTKLNETKAMQIRKDYFY